MADDARTDDAGTDDAGTDDAGTDGAGTGDAGTGDARVGSARVGDAPTRGVIPRETRRRRATKAKPSRRLFQFDKGLGHRFVAGADEAGRGCLAGPLVAAAVLFDYARLRPADIRALSALNDSKQQSAAVRAELYPVILRLASRVAIVSRCAPGIDVRGLHRTNLAALHDALNRVAVPGCMCLSDGFPVAPLAHEQRAVIGGDARSACIAAASVLAKETRDRYMRRADARHPGYEFAQHVGYATPEHRAAIGRLGVTPLHRLSFQSLAYQQLGLELDAVAGGGAA